MRRRTFFGAFAATATVPGLAAGSRTQQQLTPSFVVDAPGLEEVVTGPDGRYAFGAGGDQLLVVDCDTVDDPRVVVQAEPTLDGDAMGGIGDAAIDGDRVLVAGPTGLAEGDPPDGAALFDVSDPANPRQVASVATDHYVHNAGLSGETAYLTGSSLADQPLIAYDLSGDAATEQFRWSVVDEIPAWERVNRGVRQVHDVTVRGSYAYVSNWDAGTWILDVGDASDPTAVAQIGGVDPSRYSGMSRKEVFAELGQLPGNAHNTALSEDGTLLAVGREAGDRNAGDGRYGGPGGVELYDVSDRSNPEQLAAPRPPVVEDSDGEQSVGTAHNCHFRGDRLYASWYSSGVRVYDVGDPTEPETLGWWAAPDQASFWAAAPLDEGFVGASYQDPSASEEERRYGKNAKLYTFPEPDASGAVPAETFEVDATGVPQNRPVYDFRQTRTTTTSTTAATTQDVPTVQRSTTTTSATTEPTGTPTTTGTQPPTTGDGSGGSGGSTPGFGVGAAVAGVTLAALHRLRDD